MEVSVVVPARDAAPTIGALLDALAGAREVIVVDDASTDDTATLARAGGATVVTGAGRGPGNARNRGAAVATGSLLAFTDADCVPGPGWLDALVATAEEGADVVQGPVVAAGRRLDGGERHPFDRTVEVSAPSPLWETANLAVRADWFRRVGGFEPWLSPRRSKELAEDLWLGWRLRRAGARVAWAPGAVVEHAVFSRGLAGFVTERWRTRFFGEMVRRVPELREELLVGGLFLSRRSAAFDLALAGCATRRPLVAAAAALPYARQVAAVVAPWGVRRGAVVAAGSVAADAVGLAGLVAGSLSARTPVL